MADKKISELTAQTAPSDSDSVPIVDSVALETKRITWSVIKSVLKTYFDTLYASTASLASYLTTAAAAATYETIANVAAKAPIASPTFTGTVTLPKTVLGEISMQLDPVLSADGKWSGITRTGTAGEILVFGDLVYFKAADSKWWKADADADATAGAVAIAICVLAAAADAATEVLHYGVIRADSAFPALTIGAPAYISTTTGAIQTAQPSGTDDVIRIVGYGMTADELFFNPSNDYVTHT